MKKFLLLSLFIAVGVVALPGYQAEARMHPGCFQAKKTGPCRASIKRYYYDKKTRNCRVFYWGGCQPNLNNFKTLSACRAACYVRPVRTCRTMRCKSGYRCLNLKSGAKCVRCPIPRLARPAYGCRYIKINKRNACPRYKLVCSCKFVKCKPGTRCVQKGNSVRCIKACPTCRTMRCRSGYRCINYKGCGRCVPSKPLYCKVNTNIFYRTKCRCPRGTVKKMINRSFFRCVRPCPSCRTMRCKRGYRCLTIKGCGKCVRCPMPRLARPAYGCRYIKINKPNQCPRYKLVCSCKFVKCKPGYRCVQKGNSVRCIKACPSCRTMRCKRGYRCLTIKGCGKCVRCPMPRLARPPKGCRYITINKPNQCPRYKLICKKPLQLK